MLKFILKSVFAFAVLGLSASSVNAQFAGGTGSPGDPYQIATAEHLADLATKVNSGDVAFNEKYYILNNDIDLAAYQAGAGWTPIGTDEHFKGHFNGNNKIITGLRIDNTTLNFVGLFGIVNGGTIQDLGLEDVNIKTSKSNAGSVVAYIAFGAISNCYSTGTIDASIVEEWSTSNVGGITGLLLESNITDCYSTATVSTTGATIALAGGVAGAMAGTNTITNCYSTGAVTCSTTISSATAGGIVGGPMDSGNTTISNCYSTGAITATATSGAAPHTADAGGIAGDFNSSSSLISCYATGAISSTTPEVANAATAYAGGLVGNKSGSGAISFCAALNPSISCKGITTSFGRVVGMNSGSLSNNIAFDKMKNPDGDVIWLRIGATDHDGADISAAEINFDGTINGLFSESNGWTIQQGSLPGLFGNTVTMPDHLIWDNPFCGGNGTAGDPFQICTPQALDGVREQLNAHFILMNNLDIEDYINANYPTLGWLPIGNELTPFQGSFNGNGHTITGVIIGRISMSGIGLFGTTAGASIAKLGVEADIAGNDYVGTLAGHCSAGSTIENCYAAGNVMGTARTGGLVGYNDNASIENCYATADVTGHGNYVGGLVGQNDNASTANCYATGTVTSTDDYVGGLVGYNFLSAIKNCVAANESVTATTATANINRITGYHDGGTLSNNYALESMTLTANGAPVTITPDPNDVAGNDKTLTDLQNANFYSLYAGDGGVGWSIANPSGIWKICNDEDMFPSLRWQGILCNGETGIGDDNVATDNYSSVQVYPNPTSGELQVTSNELQVTNVEIFDVMGRACNVSRVTRNENEMDISFLPPGVYFLRITTETGVITKKVIKK